ncbi:MAG: aminotransferase class I/II-fold pyridoxal phosphate-dependent enzyme [Candidatus Moduliflexus flocculans]|nr:aminotransferase class I/II-fold pyridoxal phosphate-dependent enzyme [Candidatus Moduliflexus flocculans]
MINAYGRLDYQREHLVKVQGTYCRPVGHQRQRLLPVRLRHPVFARHPDVRGGPRQPLSGRRGHLRGTARLLRAARPAPAGHPPGEDVPRVAGRAGRPVRRLQRLQQQPGHERRQHHELRLVPGCRRTGHLRYHGAALHAARPDLQVLDLSFLAARRAGALPRGAGPVLSREEVPPMTENAASRTPNGRREFLSRSLAGLAVLGSSFGPFERLFAADAEAYPLGDGAPAARRLHHGERARSRDRHQRQALPVLRRHGLLRPSRPPRGRRGRRRPPSASTAATARPPGPASATRPSRSSSSAASPSSSAPRTPSTSSPAISTTSSSSRPSRPRPRSSSSTRRPTSASATPSTSALLPVHTYKHRDPEDLARQLKAQLKAGDTPLVMSDGIFPTFGVIAPVPEYLKALEPYGGYLCLDDSHAVGHLGPNGRGTYDHFGVKSDRCFYAGTMSKAFGGHGGFIPAPKAFIDHIKAVCGAYPGATPSPTPAMAASLKGLEIVMREPQRRERLRRNVARLKGGMKKLGFEMNDTPVPIVTWTLKSAEDMKKVQAALFDRGIAVALLKYVGAPAGRRPARLRLLRAHDRPDRPAPRRAQAARLTRGLCRIGRIPSNRTRSRSFRGPWRPFSSPLTLARSGRTAPAGHRSRRRPFDRGRAARIPRPRRPVRGRRGERHHGPGRGLRRPVAGPPASPWPRTRCSPSAPSPSSSRPPASCSWPRTAGWPSRTRSPNGIRP